MKVKNRVAVFALLIVLVLSGCGDSDGETVDARDATDEQTTEEPTTEESTTDEPTTDESTTDEQTTEEPPPPDGDYLPSGGRVPKLKGVRLEKAARAAGCKLESFEANSRGHVSDPEEEIEYPSAPPTSGKHLATPADDAAYVTAPDSKALVHSLEHGRVVIWFESDLPRRARSSLRAFYDADPLQTILTPDETGSDYEVAATAWNRDPAPNGTGRLLGCEKYTPKVFEALQAFKRKHRGKGPEAIP